MSFPLGIFDTVENALQAAHPHVQLLLAGAPLKKVRKVSLASDHAIWLGQRAKLVLKEVDDLCIDVGTKGPSCMAVCNFLRTSPVNGIPFPALRTLRMTGVDLADLVADEFYETLRSRPVPVEEVVVVFERCRNTNESELTKLASLMTVRVEAR